MLDINIRVTAENEADLSNALGLLSRFLNVSAATAPIPAGVDLTVSRTEAADKPKASRKTKAEAAEPAPADKPAAQEVEANEPAAQPATTLDVVTDKTPAELRAEAISLLQQFFGANPNNMGIINEVQTKYGVRMFSEVPDDRCAEFLADAKLIKATGSFVKAA